MSDPPGTEFRHQPVMLAEVLAVFAPVPAGWLVDITLGGAGHAAALLASRPECQLRGLDRDEVALAAANEVLAPFGDRVITRHSRFDALEQTMADTSLPNGPIVAATGVLFDLGVSSPQLDVAE